MKKFIAFAFVLTVAALAVGYMAGRDDLLKDVGIDLTPSAEAATPEGQPQEQAAGPIQVLAPRLPAKAPAPDPPARAPRPSRLHPVTHVDFGEDEPPVELAPLGAAWTHEKVVVLFETQSTTVQAPAPPQPVGLKAFFDKTAIQITVQPGDVLSRLGKRYQVDWGLLMRVNAMKTPDLMAGAVLRVVKGPFSVSVSCLRRALYLKQGATCLKTYTVAVGPDQLTPRGRFEVLSKLKNPEWTNPETHEVVPFGDRENPLGTRWIAFTPGFGIHGTNDPASIGTATSKGCIRMHNKDAEEVYDFLVKGCTVEITD